MTNAAADRGQGYKRRQYFIKRDFQAGFILKFSLVLLAGIIVSTALLFLLSQDTLTSSYADSRLQIRSTGQAIMPAVIMTNLITLGFVSLGAVVVMIYLSHRIAGPMFRFEKDLRRVSDGDLRVRINLRKKDQLKDISAALNQMIQSMHEKVVHIDGRLEKIEASCSEGGSCSEGIDKEIARLRADIRNHFQTNR